MDTYDRVRLYSIVTAGGEEAIVAAESIFTVADAELIEEALCADGLDLDVDAFPVTIYYLGPERRIAVEYETEADARLGSPEDSVVEGSTAWATAAAWADLADSRDPLVISSSLWSL